MQSRGLGQQKTQEALMATVNREKGKIPEV